MTRYTREALQDLARVWPAAADRHGVTVAGDEVDRILGLDAPQQGSNTGAVHGN